MSYRCGHMFQGKNSTPGFYFLEEVIQLRKKNPKVGSYTNRLFDSGINKIAQKVGEEAVELVIEAKDQDREKFLTKRPISCITTLCCCRRKNVTLEDVEPGPSGPPF